MKALSHGGVLLDGKHEPGFEVPTSPGVMLRPLLTKEQGKQINVLYGTIEDGLEITRERHDFSETLIVISGELTAIIEEGDTATVGEGQVWHLPAGSFHVVKNTGSGRAHFVLLAGL